MKKIWIVLAAAAAMIVWGAAPVMAGPNDFTVTSFEADYYLGADTDGRSTLKTVERLTAEFPSADQNHGIERALPKNYSGHTTNLKIESVKDGAGKELPYTTDSSNNNLVLRIGDKDTYVHGTQVYVLTYSQRDVTKYFDNTKRDEFYWNTNGTQWQQPFGSVTARVHLSDVVAPKVTGDLACYKGSGGSKDTCEIAREGNTITARTGAIGPYQNMTIAVGFAAGTWRDYEPSLWDKIVQIWILVTIITSIIGAIAIAVLLYFYTRAHNRTKELKPIAPEYIPPKNASVLLSAEVGEGTRSAITAQIIDLSVRHYLKLYQTAEKTMFKTAEYELEIAQPIADLREEEQELIKTLFGAHGTAVGARLPMKELKNDYKMATVLRHNTTNLQEKLKTTYQMRHKVAAVSKKFKTAAWVLLFVGLVTVSPALLVAAAVAGFCAAYVSPFTDTGLALRRYLAGLKMYIGVAEEERLKMLQSPEGAQKTGVRSPDNPEQLVKVYERVLPYAVLFGQEKDWSKQLGHYYEQTGTSPDWYAGQTAFNAGVFAGAMSEFNSVTNSYAGSSGSSSGGSGGGGSSGGGGGGGGGGGW